MQQKQWVVRINKTGALALVAVMLCVSLVATSLAAAQKTKPAKKPSAASIASGKKVYEQFKCANCHAIAGKGGKSGPDLSNEGGDPKHTPQWLALEVKDPKSHKPDGSMPAFAEKIQGAALTDLVAYMGSLKKK